MGQYFLKVPFSLIKIIKAKIKSLSGRNQRTTDNQRHGFSDLEADYLNAFMAKNNSILSKGRILFIENSTSFNSNLPLAKFFISDFNKENLPVNNSTENAQAVVYTKDEILHSSELEFFYDKNVYDLIVCRLHSNRSLFNIETIIYENFYPLLSDQGVLIVQIDKTSLTDTVNNLFSGDAYFETISSSGEDSDDTDHVLVQLRKKMGTGNLNKGRSFYLPLSDKEFNLRDIESLYACMLKYGCTAKTASDFASNMENNTEKGNFLVKHDIHHDLRRTLNFAEMEADLGILSVFFAMPDHNLTQKYFDSKYMWNVFERITEMGHELAFHLDLHDLVLRYGDLAEGISQVTNKFKENGFKMKTANLHGNTSLRKLYGSPKAFLKKKDADTESLRHLYPICHDDFQQYYASMSLESLARDFGLENWIDAEFFLSGVNLRVPNRCSDNTGAIKLGNRSGNLFTSEKYCLSKEFCENVASSCSEVSTIFLLHPQYYELP